MFNCDRFAAGEDYGPTYRRVGGEALDPGEVARVIEAVADVMVADSRDPAKGDRLDSVCSYLGTLAVSRHLPDSERRLLEEVFALHEIGTIPESHAEALRSLRGTHRLGVVSNIWSESRLFRSEFERAGVLDLFEVIVFSSDHGFI